MSQVYSPLARSEQPGFLPATGGAAAESSDAGQPGNALRSALMRPDGIYKCLPPATSSLTGTAWGAISQGPYSMIVSMFGQIMQALQSLMQMLGGGAGAFPAAFGPGGPQTQYTNATLSSTGDPHLAFNGTGLNGNSATARYDSMTGHDDLFDSDSFSGGYQVSTQTTSPNAQGITMNKNATITSNYGQTKVGLDNAGNATITQNGLSIDITAGQTIDLGNGETVTKNSDGSLNVINSDGMGGTINTTLRANDGGVNVTSCAHNVDLGGDLVNAAVPQQVMQPLVQRPLYLA